MSDDEYTNEREDYEYSLNSSLTEREKRDLLHLKSYFFLNNPDLPQYIDPLEVYKNVLNNNTLKDIEEFEQLTPDSIQVYLFITSKYYFPNPEYVDEWEIVAQKANITDDFTLFENVEDLLTSTKMIDFQTLLTDFVNNYLEYGFDPEDFTRFIQRNQDYLETLPSLVFTITHYMKAFIVDQIPSEDLTVEHRMWQELYEFLSPSITREAVVEGIKWMIAINFHRDSERVITRYMALNRFPELNIEEMFVSLFEDENQTVDITSIYLYRFLNQEQINLNPEYRMLFNHFKNFLIQHKDQIPPSMFRGFKRIQERHILNILNCGTLDQQIGNFRTQFQINQELVHLLFRYQIGFQYQFFETLVQYVLEPFEETHYETIERFNESRNYLSAQIEDVLSQNSDAVQIRFEMYLMLKDKLPFLTRFRNKIIKSSIKKFLDRKEPRIEVVNAWEEMWRLENGENSPPPPVPEWFINDYDTSNVHDKTIVKITDCRLKLLRENNKNVNQTVDDIAEDIERETRKVAEFNAKTEKVKIGENQYRSLTEEEEMEYIHANTVTKREVFNCRISENDPRYYGFGEIYDPERARQLQDDQRVEICRVLVEIWNVIQSTRDQELMWRTLITQFTGIFKEHLNEGVCNQGLVGSMTSVFASFAKELGYLCINEDENTQKIEVLKNKFLAGLRGDIVTEWPTIYKMFHDISDILGQAKYDDELSEKLEEEMKMAQTDEEIRKAQLQLDNYRSKVEMYDILFEAGPEVTREEKKKVMTKFVNDMKIPFFMDAYVFFNEAQTDQDLKESVINIKKALLEAFRDFLEFQLNKI